MRLRTLGLIATLAFGLFVAPLLTFAQQPAGKIARIGYLSRKIAPDPVDKTFFQALRDLGWIEGQNIAIEYRWAEYELGRLPALAEELVRLKVDLIVTHTRRVALEAKNATKTIPIVMRTAANAVENGLVVSLAEPGGNVTGLSEQHPEINTKLLELLHETLPKVTQVAFLWDPESRVYASTFRAAQAAAPTLGLTLQSLELRRMEKTGKSKEKTAEELRSLLATAAHERAGALVVMSRIYRSFGPTIAEFAAKEQIPVFSISGTAVKKHLGLLAYTHDSLDMARRAAEYVDKILKGAKPQDLPVQLPQKFKLLVNLKTAKQLGIEIPPSVLYRADKVIK